MTVELQAERGDGRADGRALPVRRRRPAGADLARPGQLRRARRAGRSTPTERTAGSSRVEAPAAPTQVIVDPDHALLDAVPDNNRWKPEVSWRLTPLMTPLDESGQFQAYDRPSVVAGPFVDQYARGGFKVGRAAGRPLADHRLGGDRARAPRGDLRRPGDPLSISPGRSGRRASFTKRVCTTSTTTSATRAAAPSCAIGSCRRRASSSTTRGSSSSISAPATSSGPATTAGPVNGWLDAVGGRYRLSTLFPYWDPVQGRLDRGHGRVRQPGVRVGRQLRPDDGRVRGRPADSRRLGPPSQEPDRLPGLRRVLEPGQAPAVPARRRHAAPGPRPEPEPRQLGLAVDVRVAVPALGGHRPGRARPRGRVP